jgi:nicotinamide-nucleotide amidase
LIPGETVFAALFSCMIYTDIYRKEKITMGNIEEAVIRLLSERKETATTVESCTGGMVAAALTSVPGSSAVFQRGFVTYCDKAKHEMVGVREETLQKHTAVSRETAIEMAQGGAREAAANYCVSVTGYAGPDTGSGECVGLVYVGCAYPGKTDVKEFRFSGDRQEIRAQAAKAALSLLLEHITEQIPKEEQ